MYTAVIIEFMAMGFPSTHFTEIKCIDSFKDISSKIFTQLFSSIGLSCHVWCRIV